MSRRRTHEEVELRMRALLDEHDLAPPDEVEHWPDSIALIWHAARIMVIVDLDDDPDGAGPVPEHPLFAVAGWKEAA